jgi:cysteinyl-tRNA synthetase
MSKKYLGETFDIHAGGRDLIFPHHENEIAQSEAACGKTMSRWWMHNGLVNIDNEKMSKSLGNFFTVRQVLEKFDAQTLRFYLLATHYRSPINFSDAALGDAEQRVRYFYETLKKLNEALGQPAPEAYSPQGELRQAWVTQVVPTFDAAMNDDFNTPEAIGALSDSFRLVNDILAKPADAATDRRTLEAIKKILAEVGAVLGLFLEEPTTVLARISDRRKQALKLDPAAIEKLIAERAQARGNKNFKRADDIRQHLLSQGVSIKDSATGTSWEVI